MQCITLAGPSCSGKDTILREFLAQRTQFGKPVTTTTRPPREGEVPGVSYHFVTDDAFHEGLASGAFVESAQYGKFRYGLTHRAIIQVEQDGRTPLVILDVQGVASLRQQRPVLRVFVYASVETLRRRLTETRPADQVEDRIAAAIVEIEAGLDSDLVLLNEDGTLEQNLERLYAWADRINSLGATRTSSGVTPPIFHSKGIARR